MDQSTVAAIGPMPNDSATSSSVSQPLNDSYVNHAPQFTHAALIRVYVLVMLGIISLVGNVAILLHISKTRNSRRNSRHTWSAIYTLILHLSIADLLVTIFCIFGEAAWNYTVEWIAGEISCKMMKLFQMFALYLSTYVLVLIGIDRWVAVKYPMKSLNMAKRCHRLLIFSYILSLVMSLPQYYIFTVTRGPFIEEFYQCVTYGSYSAPWQEQLYTMFTLVFMFIIPLGILLLTYVSTFKTIADSEKIFQVNETSNDQDRKLNNRQKLIHRAKMKSLRLSVAIVAAFIICWTPYYISMLIFMFMNPDERFGDDLMSAIFFFGMSNSVANPIIYGAFSLWPVRNRNRKKSTYNNNNNRSSFTREYSQSQKGIVTSMTTMLESSRRISKNQSNGNGHNAQFSNIKYHREIPITSNTNC
ncbi:gonadotropin-releasing hormone receptor isoform X2 [Sitodiplosis mosellana]|uniref:gonadotropin-releasing hormone receptor isoform X2 n=1 Tax=Sitodiplosis mosellana TaxID=263140 RepID=UPI00244531F7|nr:gonadotropin-releasing hormone receptor isoform X2 [Sitodiplosis mosellana]